VPSVGDEAAMRDWAAELVERARTEGVELTGDNGLLTALVRQVLQTGLEVEMTDHLGYERQDPAGRGSGNSRNGSHPKTVTTEIGKVDLRVPRDRNASFEPVTVPKGAEASRGPVGQRHFALREGDDHRRHPVPDARQRHRPEIERLRGHGVSFRSAVIVGFGEVDGGSVAARNDEQ
jgi:hypothetical protein